MASVRLCSALVVALTAAACNAPSGSFSLSGGETRAYIEPQDRPLVVGRTSSIQFGAFRSTYARCGDGCLDDPGLDVLPVKVVDARCEPGCVITSIGSNAMRPEVGVVTIAGTRAGTSELTLLLDVGGGLEKLAHRSIELRAPSRAWISSRAGDGVAMVAGASAVVQASAGESDYDRGLVESTTPGVGLVVEGDAVTLRPSSIGWDMVAEHPGDATLVLDVGGTSDRRPIRVVDRAAAVGLDVLRQDYEPLTTLSLSVHYPALVRILGRLGDATPALLPPGVTCTVDPPDLAKLDAAEVEHGIGLDPTRAGTGVLQCAFGAATASRPVIVRE